MWAKISSLDNNRSARYAKEWMELMRQNTNRGYSDGGVGDYGPNSGGYDHLSFNIENATSVPKRVHH